MNIKFKNPYIIYTFARAQAIYDFLCSVKNYSTVLTLAFVVSILISFPNPCFAKKGDKKNKASQLTSMQLLKSQKSDERLNALENLRAERKAENNKDIKTALKSESDPLVRHRMNQALANTDDASILETLIGTLQTDSSVMVRKGAADALAKFAKNINAANALAKAFREDTSSRVKYACILSLSLSNSLVALNALEEASNSQDVKMRKQVAYCLPRNESREVTRILSRLKNDSDSKVRNLAEKGRK